MLQRYRTNISGSSISRKGSLHRLENLFHIEEGDNEKEDNLESAELVGAAGGGDINQDLQVTLTK